MVAAFTLCVFAQLTDKQYLMYYIAERNERRSRRLALALAVTLHLALGALLYLQTSETPTVSSDVPATAKTVKTRTVTDSRP